ncbi:Tat pathway signal sequence domain protein [Streptomyces sp. Li-HN-5-11]|uniref:Tat pathway signal sequence domain protein n=1 Tax=Streptomyces sp. Li-HN-5-11 TaxID=3075432 RepID=UPI0028AFD0ED|nr:Tat pathway signal sequence domain protein [Streptomyces sp. Li-HN-5-11]WNM33698.1 Tat pathway signal sequence domain protein [Streptomyces sp. Li-HN-5-11]
MRRHTASAVAATAALTALALLSATAASADGAVLTYGSAGGNAVSVGDVLTSSLASGTKATLTTSSNGTSGITCTGSTLSATVTDNPATPGTATESATSQTFSGCTSNVFGVFGVQSITVNNLPYTTSAGSDGTVSVTPAAGNAIQTTVVLSTLLGSVTCVYQAPSLSAVSSNSAGSLAFTNQAFTKVSGSGLCTANGYFTATYAPVVDSSVSGAPAVYTN